MTLPKICWITPDCFLDVDYPIIPNLLCKFKIHWIILLGLNHRFQESDFEKIVSSNSNITIEFIYFNQRARNPHTLIDYIKVLLRIKKQKPDLIYFNVVPSNPYILPLYFWLPINKTIVTAHDGRVTKSMKYGSLVNIGFTSGFKRMKYINMFSKYQASFFEERLPGKNITIIPLALKDFGKPTISKRTDCISFVYFGTIHFEKNLELLIEAANQLVEEGIKGFKVSINGSWRVNWNLNEKIRHPEVFETWIDNVPNEAIPNIFSKNHYAVYPYKNMSQSGAIKCAFNYNTPVIVSDLPGFTEEVVEGVNGFIFESGNINDLKRVMQECINHSQEDYNLLLEKMMFHTREKYSLNKIVEKYVNMFNKVCEQ